MCTLREEESFSHRIVLVHFLTTELADFVSARALPAPVSFFFPLPASQDSALTSVSFHSGHNDVKRGAFRMSAALNEKTNEIY